MRKKYIKMILMLVIFSLIFSTTASSIKFLEKNVSKNISNDKGTLTFQNDNLEVSIEPLLLFRGLKLKFTNNGDTDITNINWCFSLKPVITAYIGKGDICSQSIDSLAAGKEKSIVLRPYIGEIPSPRGLGRVYMKLQAEADGVEMVRDQKQVFLLLCILYNMRDTYIDIPPDDAYSMVMDDSFDLIIDVVGLDIYSIGHLPGAVNYVWADRTLESMIPSLDKNGTYLVYCHTDPPSTASAQMLVNSGIQSVYRLEGNYRAWVEAGYPIET